MKIAHVFTSAHDGGLERIVLELCSGLNQLGHTSQACALLNDNPGASEFTARGIPFYTFGAQNRGRLSSFFPNMAALEALASHLSRAQIDVVIVHDFFPGILGRLAALLARVPIRIATLHSTYDWLGRMPHAINCLFGLSTQAVVSVSKAAQTASRNSEWIASSKRRIIANGIDTNRFHPLEESPALLRQEFGIPEDAIAVGTIGVLRRSKRQIDLVQAAAPLLEEFPRLHLVFIGSHRIVESAYAKEFLAELSKLPSNRWTHLESLDDMPRLYGALDIVCQPSDSEGFGLVVAEAIACHRRVIVTDIPAHREVAGEFASYFIPGALEKLRDDLRTSISDVISEAPFLYSTLDFSLKTMISGWNTLLTSLAAKI